MKAVPVLRRWDSAKYLTGGALLALCALAWASVLTQQGGMPSGMSGMEEHAAGPLRFTLNWGVMMAAMMLPSAAPMIFLYARVAGEIGLDERALPPLLFAAVYLVVWLLTGFPVYAASRLVTNLASSSPAFADARTPLLGALVVAAGLYQFSPLKTTCLRFCESPLTLLMRRWRAGYKATLRIAIEHAAYCIGCCWGLMIILVAVGAMSLPWVLLIATAVFAEKVLPFGFTTAKVIGAVMVLFGTVLSARSIF